jgi:hypothetical protein
MWKLLSPAPALQRAYSKAPAKLLTGAFDFLAETTFTLRSCRGRSSCFLVLVDPGWPAQHDFAHEHPVADCRVIDGRRHIWSNGRPTYGATLWINDGRVSRVVIARWCHIRRSPERKVIRIRSVRNDCAGSIGCCCLSCSGPCYRVSRCRSSRGFLRQRYPQRCRESHSSRQ